MTTGSGPTRLCVYNGGLLMRRPVRRILECAGWDVTTGVPGAEDWVGIWGRSPTAWRGEAVAGWTDAPVLTVEDAFLRSVLPGRLGGGTPAGLSLDRTGVHFDASSPSDLETLLATHPLDDAALLGRARDAIEQITHWHLGKYCATDLAIDPPAPGYVIVVDQTRGDAALMGAGDAEFREMLVIAAEEHPGLPILIKTHSETAGGARQGHFAGDLPVDRARLYDAPVSPWRLFEGAVGVYTHSSTLGFEAMFAGHKPRVFGQPFYAGWGLTDDRNPVARRERKLTRAQLFAAAMILYPVWYDAVGDRRCEIEDAVVALAAQARAWREDRSGYVFHGMSRWKRRHLKAAFGSGTTPVFTGSAARAAKDARKHVVWGAATAPEDVIRMEDGLLRSRGLGAALVPPVSLVLDRRGIYYDPSKPSDLDVLIAGSGNLPPAEIRRAERLADRISRLGLTKYNIRANAPVLDDPRRKVLVVGQVEDDASIRLGAGEVRTNLGLLRSARTSRPEALILWKPHPDVEAGLRRGAVAEADLEGLADIALQNIGAEAALALADEVWTMTSTLGFEALLRGKPVHCLGTPFYAGWGLTEDRMPRPAHRRATPTLAGFVHACLIGYPRYFDPESGAALSPEQAVDVLARDDGQPARVRAAGIAQRLFHWFGRSGG